MAMVLFSVRPTRGEESVARWRAHPMRHLGVVQGTWAAIKADTFSLTSGQVGMYGFMAVAHFWTFHHLLGLELKADMPEFWSTMQVAMIFGFLTSDPVNWWLLRTGLKEKM